MEEGTEDALEVILWVMNDAEEAPLLADSNTDFSVRGLMGVRFISGTTIDGDKVGTDGGSEGGLRGARRIAMRRAFASSA